MANEVKLEVYTFKVRENKSREDEHPVYKQLSNFIDNDDFIDFFQGYLTYIETGLEKYEDQFKAIKLKQDSLKFSSKNRIISGIFESGSYGYESLILSLSDKKKRIKKEIDDIEILPFYFLLYIPKDKDVGILILQRFGINGINTIFRHSFKQYFNGNYNGVVLEIDPFVSKELAAAFIDGGGVKEIILRKYNLPVDKADKLGLKNYATRIQSVELRVKAKRNTNFPGLTSGIKKYIRDPNAKFFDFKELRAIGFDGTHKISIVSELDGKERVIDLSDSGKIRPYYDVDKDVKRDRSNHPEFDSIDEVAKGLLKSFIEEL